MLVTEFEYVSYSGPSPFNKKKRIFFNIPAIPVELEYGSIVIPNLMVLVDTGSSRSVFSWDIGLNLGINIKKGDKCRFGGVGGKIPVWFHEIRMRIGSWDYKTDVGFVKRGKLPVIGLLGHEGFFERFDVKFMSNKQRLEISYNR